MKNTITIKIQLLLSYKVFNCYTFMYWLGWGAFIYVTGYKLRPSAFDSSAVTYANFPLVSFGGDTSGLWCDRWPLWRSWHLIDHVTWAALTHGWTPYAFEKHHASQCHVEVCCHLQWVSTTAIGSFENCYQWCWDREWSHIPVEKSKFISGEENKI